MDNLKTPFTGYLPPSCCPVVVLSYRVKLDFNQTVKQSFLCYPDIYVILRNMI